MKKNTGSNDSVQWNIIQKNIFKKTLTQKKFLRETVLCASAILDLYSRKLNVNFQTKFAGYWRARIMIVSAYDFI